MALYEVTYTPLAVVERECAKRGMKDGDGTSYWDWVEDGNLVHAAGRYTDFRGAALHAKSLVPADVCGEVTVEQIARLQPKDGPPRWETLAEWYVYDDTDPASLSADDPHLKVDPTWDDGDELLCGAA